MVERIKNDEIVRLEARTTFESLGKRLRSPPTSPQKRGHLPTFEQVGGPLLLPESPFKGLDISGL